jgi:hypothetical protein
MMREYQVRISMLRALLAKAAFFTNRRQLTGHRSRRKSSTNARTGYMAPAAPEFASIGIPKNDVEAVQFSTLSAVSAK